MNTKQRMAHWFVPPALTVLADGQCTVLIIIPLAPVPSVALSV